MPFEITIKPGGPAFACDDGETVLGAAMRADLKAKRGASFSLETFHNDFMRQGFPPIKIVREALLGDDSPVL